MKLYVGVMDNDWFEFLSRLPNVDAAGARLALIA